MPKWKPIRAPNPDPKVQSMIDAMLRTKHTILDRRVSGARIIVQTMNIPKPDTPISAPEHIWIHWVGAAGTEFPTAESPFVFGRATFADGRQFQSWLCDSRSTASHLLRDIWQLELAAPEAN